MMSDSEFDVVFNEQYAHSFTRPRLLNLLESTL